MIQQQSTVDCTEKKQRRNNIGKTAGLKAVLCYIFRMGGKLHPSFKRAKGTALFGDTGLRRAGRGHFVKA